MANPKMMQKLLQMVSASLVVALIAATHSAQLRAETFSEADKLFALKVYPTLQAKCFACHGDDLAELKGELDLRSLQGMKLGGESGAAALVPGKPGEGLLMGAVRWEDLEMPPKANDRLTDEQINALEIWIAAGAPWPNQEARAQMQRQEREILQTDAGLLVATSGGQSDEWTYRRYRPEDIWAFRPLDSADQQDAFTEGDHPIDFFVERRLAEKNLRPTAKATPEELIRRASYNLIGLPPTPEQVADFLSRWEEDQELAWEELLERLLASPHYGERWAQHWLDVVRYADTSGFSNDFERSNAWRYRDYVIRAFNDDKPYDEFVIEQLAGDEIEQSTSESVIATGFLRMGPWGTAMIPTDEARQIFLDDLVNSVGQSFLSIPMRCCKCHDHKFDPIPTRDYYRMYAAFATTQPAEMEVPFLPEENLTAFQEGKDSVQQLLDFARSQKNMLITKREQSAKEWYKKNNLPYKNVQERANDPDHLKPPRHTGLVIAEQGKLKVREQDVRIWERRLERYQPLAQSVFNGPDYIYKGIKLRVPEKQNKKWRPSNFILAGGSLSSPSEQVQPGVLSAKGMPTLTTSKEDNHDPYLIPESIAGRRLRFAKWIASPEHPLTARSIVNRVWQYHFGRGIVTTSNNFGVKGAKPTHPELLDWLAKDFVQHGWRIKRLHRLIMTSSAYMRSTQHHRQEQLQSIDPNNDLLARFLPRRLTAEEIRDSMLAVSGELHRQIGGVPAMPEINLDVALQPRMIQFSLAPAYQPSRTPEQRNRRSIYAYRVRGQANPFLETFNQPNPNESCELRDSAAVTPQSYALMNSDAANSRALGFGTRLKREARTPAGQIDRAFQLALSRDPTDSERTSMTNYLAEMREYHVQHTPEAFEYPTKLKRSLVEEFSGEPFEYEEWLPVYEDYSADPKPWTVDAETRALADVCLLLFNSNEFVYVY